MNIEQRHAVQDVILRYAQLLDTGQQHRVAAEIFTNDATIDYGGAPVIGRPAIAAFFIGFAGLLGTSHNVSNLLVTLEGAEAICHSHCLAWHWSLHAGLPKVRKADFLAVGGYEDRLRVEEGVWRIAHRRMLSFGAGIGVGAVPEAVMGLMQGMLGRLPERL
jgi:hypothetical protein